MTYQIKYHLLHSFSLTARRFSSLHGYGDFTDLINNLVRIQFCEHQWKLTLKLIFNRNQAMFPLRSYVFII